MKEINRFRLLILLFFITIFIQKSFCQVDSVHVGFVLANLYDERWRHERDYFKEKLNELGGKVTFIDCHNMQDNQVDAIKKFVEMKVDCIVIVPINARSARSAVEIVNAANIPIIAYDRLILDSNLDLFITVNSITVGQMMAEQVISKLPEGEILYVGGPKDDFNSNLVSKGVFSILDNHKDKYHVSSIVVVDWNELSAYLSIQDFISDKEYVPDAIICAADVLTYGAITILEETGNLGRVLLTGQDAELEICRQVLKGNVLMTVYKSNKTLAYTSAEAAMKLINGRDVQLDHKMNNNLIDVPSILIQPELITKDNVEKMIDKGIYTREELYKKD